METDRRQSAYWAAGISFLTALLSLGSLGAPMRYLGLLSGAALNQLLLPIALAALLYAVLRSLLWWMVRGRSGSSMFLWAAVLGLVGSSYVLSGLPIFVPIPVLQGIQRFLIYTDELLIIAAMLLTPLGLMKCRLVPTWVSAIAIASGVLYAVRLFPLGRVLLVTGGLASVLQVAFLISLGISLLGLARAPRPAVTVA